MHPRHFKKILHRSFAANLIAVLLAIMVAPILAPLEAHAYSNGYTYRRSITLEQEMVTGATDLTNFPVLISGTYTYLKTTGNGGKVQNSSGYDIIFTSDSAGATQLDHEIEKYDASTGEIVMWVRIPTLGATVDTTIYIFYGNSSISSSQEDIVGTWDGNYTGVYHLKETSGQHLDSTSNNNDSTSVSVATQGSATGKIGGADDFNGTSNSVTIPDSASLDVTTTATIEAWVKTDDVSVTPGTFSGWSSRAAPDGAGVDDYSQIDSVIVGESVYHAALLCSDATETFSTAMSSTSGNNFTGWTSRSAPGGCGASEGGSIAIDSDGKYLYYSALGIDGTAETFSFASSTLNFGTFTAWSTPGSPNGSGAGESSSHDMRLSSSTMYIGAVTVTGATETFDIAVYNLASSSFGSWVGQNDPTGAAADQGCSMGVDTTGDIFVYASNCNSSGTEVYSLSTTTNNTSGTWRTQTAPNGAGAGEHNFGDIAVVGGTIYNYSFLHADAAGSTLGTGASSASASSSQHSVTRGGTLSWSNLATPTGAGGDETVDGSVESDGKNLFYTAFLHNGATEAYYTGSSTLPAHPFVSKRNAYELIQVGTGYVHDWVGNPTTFGTSTAVSTWEHVTVTVDASDVRYYTNGVLRRALTHGLHPSIESNGNSLLLGAGNRSDGTQIYFDGIIDEVRISNVARTPDWLLTQTQNHNDPSTFYTLGSEESADETAPSPSPMTFASVPSNDSASAISMTATTATDAGSPPVEYYFGVFSCAADSGTGGTDSGWQSGESYTDSGLQANQCYGYKVQARDSAATGVNYTATSSVSEEYTSANVPAAPTISTTTVVGLVLTNNENSNPSSNPTTKFAVQISSTSPSDSTWLYKYVDSAGSPVSAASWLTDAQLTALSLQSLTGNTSYTIRVMARNEDLDETASSTATQATTTPAAPGTPSFTNVESTSLTVSWTAPTGGADTYAVERCAGSGCTNFSTTTTGVTGLSYNDSGLTANTTYSYRITGKGLGGYGVYSSSADQLSATGAIKEFRLKGGTRLRGIRLY